MNKKTKIIVVSSLAVVIAALLVGLGILIFSGNSDNDTSSKNSSATSEVTSEKTETPIFEREETTPNEDENVEKIEINKNEASITVEDDETKRGETIEVPITLNKNPGIAASALEIQYNTHKLTYVGYEEGEVFENYMFKEGKDALYFSNIENGDTTKNGVIFTLKFKVKEDAAIGKTEIKINAKENESFMNFDYKAQNLAVGNAIINIK